MPKDERYSEVNELATIKPAENAAQLEDRDTNFAEALLAWLLDEERRRALHILVSRRGKRRRGRKPAR